MFLQAQRTMMQPALSLLCCGFALGVASASEACDSTDGCTNTESDHYSFMQTFTSNADEKTKKQVESEMNSISEEQLGKMQYLLEFRTYAKQNCPHEFEACKANMDCEEAMFDVEMMFSNADGPLTELLNCTIASHGDNATLDSFMMIDAHAAETLGDEPSFGKQVGIGAVGGVAGNLATAGLSSATGLVWDGVAQIPGGKEVAEVGRMVTCAFGMGCDSGPSNSDVIDAVTDAVQAVGADLKNEMHLIKDELSGEIDAVKDTMIEAKDAILTEMSTLGTNIENKIQLSQDAIMREVTFLTNQQTQKLTSSLNELKNLVNTKFTELRTLAERHNFQNHMRQCDTQVSSIKTRFDLWRAKIAIAAWRTSEANAASSASVKEGHLRDSVQLMADWWSLSENEETRIAQDINGLVDCISNTNIFDALAQTLKGTSMSTDEKLSAIASLFSRYLAVLAEGDALYSANLVYFQLKKNQPNLRPVMMQLSISQLKRAKINKAFFDALNGNNLISHSCPRCDIRYISRGWGWRGYKQYLKDGAGGGCSDVRKFVQAYSRIKDYFGAFNPAIKTHAKPFLGYGSICKIYYMSVTSWRGGCYGDSLGRSTEYFADRSRSSAAMYCSGW
jgi:hypothetical protein